MSSNESEIVVGAAAPTASNDMKSEIPMGAAVVPTTTTAAHHHPVMTEKKTSGLAIASLVCGIVGFFFFGLILGILAIIFGSIAMNKIKEKPNELQGLCMAKGGLICGIICIVLWIIIIIAISTSAAA